MKDDDPHVALDGNEGLLPWAEAYIPDLSVGGNTSLETVTILSISDVLDLKVTTSYQFCAMH